MQNFTYLFLIFGHSTSANSVDPDQTVSEEESDLIHTVCQKYNKKIDLSK